jgi:hypothetical protein
MGRNNKSVRFGMPESAHDWVDEIHEDSGLHKVQVLNGMLSLYRDKTSDGEWSKPDIGGMGEVPSVRKVYRGYRISPTNDVWLDKVADEHGEDKGDVLFKILKYCAGKYKTDQFDIEDITA